MSRGKDDKKTTIFLYNVSQRLPSNDKWQRGHTKRKQIPRTEKVEVDGKKFDSKWEAERYNQLSAMQQAGQIKDLQRQVKFVLQDGYVNNKGEKIRPICYFADFQYTDNEGRQIVEDTKSPATKTEVFKIKKKLFEAKFPEYIFIEKYKK